MAVLEPACGIGRGHAGDSATDGIFQERHRPRTEAPEHRLDLRPSQLDGVEVWRVGRLIDKMHRPVPGVGRISRRGTRCDIGPPTPR